MVTKLNDFSSFDSFLPTIPTVRKNNNRAKKNGVYTEIETDITVFYRFYSDMAKRNNARKIFPLEWFSGIYQQMGTTARLQTAFRNKHPIGSVLYFISPKEIYNYFTVIDYHYRHLQAGTMLFLSLFRDAFSEGIQQVNLGPDVIGSPTFEFKKRFHAHPVPFYHYQFFRNPFSRLRFKFFTGIRHYILQSPSLYKILRKIIPL
jgi:lipid II:glycine glycyltransferase (peptidoglycan interpeptide bridge formation enzyme)